MEAFDRSWVVYTDFNYEQNRWQIGKVERATWDMEIARPPSDMHIVYAVDEMAAYAKVQRTLDKLETHSEGDNFRL